VIGYAALSLAVARANIRDRITLFFCFVFPLIFLVIFGLLLAPAKGRGEVIQFLAPGLVCWAVANGAVFGVAYTLVQWRENGMLRVLRMTRVSVPTVLGSRLLVALTLALAQIAFFTGIAALPIFGLHLGRYAGLTLLPMLLGVVAFFTIGMVIGSRVSSSEAIAAIANCILVPMAFLSGSFYPLDQSPGWLRAVSLALPLRHMIDGVSGVLPGGSGPTAILVPCLALLGYTLVLLAFATKLFRWSREA
jgi:ABC-2 type transport system permease protein